MNMGSTRVTRRRQAMTATATVRDNSMLTVEGVSALRDRIAAQVETLTGKIDAMAEGDPNRAAALIGRLAMETKLEEIETQISRMETKGN